MRLLLDTHIAIWAVLRDARLSKAGYGLIVAPGNDILVSVASLWEIAIKHALNRGGRTDMPVSAREARSSFLEAGFRILAISDEHALAIEALPMLHADPFDRLIVAQALTEPARLLTHDTRVAAYSDTIIAV